MLQQADSRTISNSRGSKKSEVNVSFEVTKGDQYHIWGWRIAVTVKRNNMTFDEKKDISLDEDVYDVLNQMVQAVCTKIVNTYNQDSGCNVETGPIVDFVEAQKAEFINKMHEAKI